MAYVLAHVACLLLLPPLLQGILVRVKSWFSGRSGPSILQPYRDLARLFAKGAVFSPTTTLVFRLGPAVGVATVLVAGLLVPLSSWGAPVSFSGDLVAFAYLLGLGRFLTVLAALDTGSSFEGMGASREVTFASLAEPALFLGFAVLARATRSLSLEKMLGWPLPEAWQGYGVALGLTAVSLFLVFLAENCRIPVDDPTTHLELTMIHEVMVLDHSGPDFGLILYGASMKFMVLGALLVDLLVPLPHWEPWPRLGLELAGLAALACMVGIVESTMARLRISRVPLLLVAAAAFPAFGLALTYV